MLSIAVKKADLCLNLYPCVIKCYPLSLSLSLLSLSLSLSLSHEGGYDERTINIRFVTNGYEKRTLLERREWDCILLEQKTCTEKGGTVREAVNEGSIKMAA